MPTTRRLSSYALRAAAWLAALCALCAALAATGVLLWARDDQRLTVWAQQALYDAAGGKLRLSRLHWSPPLRLTAEGVAISDHADEPPALLIHRLESTISIRAIARGRLDVGPIKLMDPELVINLANEGKPKIDEPSGAEQRTLAENLVRVLTRLPRFAVHDVTVSNGRLMLQDCGGAALLEGIGLQLQLSGTGAGSVLASAALQVGEASLTALFGPDAAPTSGAQLLTAHQIALTLDDVLLARATDGNGQAELQLRSANISLNAPGMSITSAVTGRLFGDDSYDVQVASRAVVAPGMGTLQQLFDGPARRALGLQGTAHVKIDASGQGSLRSSPMLAHAAVAASVQGSALEALHIPLHTLAATGEWRHGQDVHIDAAAHWDAHSTLALNAHGQLQNGLLGDHALSLVVEDLAVRSLVLRLQPLAQVAPALRQGLHKAEQQKNLLPQAATLRLHGQGTAFWPKPQTLWAMVVQATQISGTQAVPMPSEALPVTLSLLAQADDTGLVLHGLDVVFGHNRIALNAYGRCGWSTDEPAQLRVAADTLRLAALLRGTKQPLSMSRLKLTLGLSGTPNAPKGRGALALFRVNIAKKVEPSAKGAAPDGIDLGDINLPLNFTGGTLMTRGATLAGQALQASVTGFVQLLGQHNKKLPKHAMQLDMRLLSPDVEALMGRPQNLRGPSRLSGRVLVGGSMEAPELAADVRARGPFGQAALFGAADAAQATVGKMAIVPSTGGAIWADGMLTHEHKQLRVHAEGELPNAQGNQLAKLLGDAQGSLDDKIALKLAINTQDSDVVATGDISPKQQELEMSVGSHLSIGELASWNRLWSAAKPTGRISGQIHMRGPLFAPRAQGTLMARGLGIAGKALGGGRMQALLQTPEAGRYHLEVRAPRALTADVDVYPKAQGGVRIEADIPHFALAALYPPLGLQGADVQGDLLLDVKLGRRTWSPRGSVLLRHLVASSRGQQMQLEEPTTIRLDGINLGVSRLRMSGAPGRLALEGHLGPAVRASLAGQMALSFVTPFVPALTYARGEMTVDAKASGPRNAPVIEAAVQVTQPVVLRPRGAPMEVRLASGTLRLTPNKLIVDNLHGGIEGGAFELFGEVNLHRLQPTSYALRLDGHGIPVREGDLMLEGNVALSCKGPADRPVVAGTIDIIAGRYLRALELRDFSFVGHSVDVRLPTAYQLPWLKNIGLDVHTISHDGVDIAINASAFALKARVETDLHIGGSALDPKLTGKVQARDGTITFPRADLQLSQASIDFEAIRRSRKNPVGAEVLLRASGEVIPTGAGGDTQNYQINMNLDGPPESLVLDLSSDNGKLSKLAVLSLLSTGNVDVAAGARSGDEAAKLETAEALVGSVLTAPLSRFAQRKIEQVFNVNVDLSIKTNDGAVTLVTAKNINRRLRLEGAYSHGVGLTNTDQSNISARAQMALTDRLRLEGNAAQNLTGASQSVSQTTGMQSNLELKYRLMGP